MTASTTRWPPGGRRLGRSLTSFEVFIRALAARGHPVTDYDPDCELIIPLGGDSYCETCGWSNNEVEAWKDGHDWAVTLRYGCYGGAYVGGVSAQGVNQEDKSQLEALFTAARRFQQWSDVDEVAISLFLGIDAE